MRLLVDSSVWIDFFRGTENREVSLLRRFINEADVLVGDLVLVEVMQGFATERRASVALEALRRFDFVPVSDAAIAVQAAAHYRALRRQGVTIRKTIDLLIGTACVENGWTLLHRDRDFERLREHLGLATA